MRNGRNDDGDRYDFASTPVDVDASDKDIVDAFCEENGFKRVTVTRDKNGRRMIHIKDPRKDLFSVALVDRMLFFSTLLVGLAIGVIVVAVSLIIIWAAGHFES